jgi:iron(III) transport system substrate-binding protein
MVDRELLNGSQKEEKLVIYGTVEEVEMKPWLEVFSRKYPFIRAAYRREYVYGTPPPMAKKIINELSNGQSADIVMSAISPQIQMQRLGLFESYISPERKNIPAGFKDQQGYWTSILLLPTILAYNPTLVSEGDIPHTIEALSDPRWDGVIGLHDVKLGTFGDSWLSALEERVGRERWIKFVDRLGSLSPKRFPLFRQIVGSLTNGETKIGLTVLLYEYLKARDLNKPINRLVIDGIPLLTSATAISLLSSSQHPNSAKMFIDFILSIEGQELIGNSYIRIPAARNTKARHAIERLLPGEKIEIFPVPGSESKLSADTEYFMDAFK